MEDYKDSKHCIIGDIDLTYFYQKLGILLTLIWKTASENIVLCWRGGEGDTEVQKEALLLLEVEWELQLVLQSSNLMKDFLNLTLNTV